MLRKLKHIIVLCSACQVRNLTPYFCFIFLFILFQCKSPEIQQPAKQPGDLMMAEACKARLSYDSAITYYRKVSETSAKSSEWSTWSTSINGIIDCYRSKGDLSNAKLSIDYFDSIATNRIGTHTEIYANLLQKRALWHYDKGENEASNKIFQQSIQLRKGLGLKRDTTLALSYNGMGNNYLYLGRYEESLSLYMQAIRNYEGLGMTKSADYAMFNQNVGIIHAIKGEYESANKYFQLSLSINKSILSKDDPKLALVYLNLGRFFSLTGDDEKALELLTQSENIFKTHDSRSPKLSSIYLNIGAIYVTKANYEKALSYYNNALALIQANQQGNPNDLLTTLLNLGFIHEKKGDYNTAKSFYEKGLENGDKFQNSLKILRGLANISFLQENFSEASRYYQLALEKSIEIMGPENPETALTYFKYGEFCSLTGDKSSALNYLLKGLEIYKNTYGDKSRDVALGYLFIGNFFERTKQYPEAAEYYQKSLIAGFEKFNDQDIFKNPVPDNNTLSYNQLNMLSGKASALYNLYSTNPIKKEYLTASADTYTLALQILELLRSTYQEEDSKLLIAGNERRTIVNAIRSQISLYNLNHDEGALEKAFAYSEKGKSSVLLSYLRDTEAKSFGNIPEKLRKLDNKLKTDVAFYNKLIFEESLKSNASQVKINNWNNTIFVLSREHDSLIRVFESEYPEYYNLKYDNSVITLKDVARKLNSDQALIEYTLSDSVLYILAVSHNRKRLLARQLIPSFYEDLRTVREMLIGKSFNNYSPEDFIVFTRASYQLYQVLLQPVEDLIKEKNLIIVPDAELGYLSFDILLTKPVDEKSKGYRNLSYLIKQVPVSYAPSATALFENYGTKSKKSNHKVLAFAPSYENIKGVKVEELMRGKTYRDYLLPIPGAQVEVQNLQKILRSNVFNGDEATEGKFKKIASNYSILHLAMHTIINNKNPLYSKLVFYHNNDTTEDGLLNTSELFGMQLNADLAVLSACNTGTGKLEKGEGIMSLSRGFFYAGVPSIIMTSWAVEDQSGSELMSSFYKYLAEGKPKNIALQLAKIEYLENADQLKSHPHFWAAYMNIGDISSIPNLKKPVSLLIYIVAGAGLTLILALSFLLIRRKARSR